MYFCREFKRIKMGILPEQLEKYLTTHTTEADELLSNLERETFQKTTQPQMLSGGYQGRFLSLISKMIQPQKILEIGMFTGYSALCLAEGLQEDGKLLTIDRNEELLYLVKKYFEQSKYKNQIEIKIGDALEVMETVEPGSFDLIFIDADKQNYINYYQKSLELLRPGGVILADNVLWYGKVLGEISPDDKSSFILKAFSEQVKSDNRVEVIVLPIRDGISLIRKK